MRLSRLFQMRKSSRIRLSNSSRARRATALVGSLAAAPSGCAFNMRWSVSRNARRALTLPSRQIEGICADVQKVPIHRESVVYSLQRLGTVLLGALNV